MNIKIIVCFILIGIASVACSIQELPKDDQPILQLWDGGNVFAQPRKTLILALWADGKVVSRVDENGKCKLQFASLRDVPNTKLMLGHIESKYILGIMVEVSRAGFFEADKYSGLVKPDGPNVILFARNATKTNELQHEAVDDTEAHDTMRTPERKRFGIMWDSVMNTLRTVQVHDWRPVEPNDKVVTEIPWIKAGNK